MSAESAGYAVGQMIGYSLPLLIGIGASFYLRKRRGSQKLPAWPIIIGLVLTVLACTSASRAQDLTVSGVKSGG